MTLGFRLPLWQAGPVSSDNTNRGPVRPTDYSDEVEAGSRERAFGLETIDEKEGEHAEAQESRAEGGRDDPQGDEGSSEGEAEDMGVKRLVLARAPRGPKKQERLDHEVTHLPYRSWCGHCVRGKAKERGHLRADRDEGDLGARLPMVCMDYCFYSGGETVSETGAAILVVRDRDTKVTYGHMVKEKGVGDGWIVDRVAEDIENMGYSEITLKTDQEPAIRDLQRAVKEKRAPYKTTLENSPVESSGSNGLAEKAAQELEGQVRTMRSALAARIGEMPAEASVIMAWMTEAAAQLINRHQVGKDGRTPYERVHGRRGAALVAEFGEKVWYKLKKKKASAKLAPRWERAFTS